MKMMEDNEQSAMKGKTDPKQWTGLKEEAETNRNQDIKCKYSGKKQ